MTVADLLLAPPRAEPTSLRAAGAERPRSAALDGIRALAIVMVLAVHLTIQGDAARLGLALHGLPRAAFLAVSHMWLGVDLFFVLSGFLITGILLDTKHRPSCLRDFYVRRGLRILPLVALVLLLMAAFVPGHAAWYALGAGFLADLAPLLGVGPPQGAPPLWSLAVEEQFYLLWPLLVLGLSARRLALLALAIVVLEPVVRFALAGTLLEVPWFRSDGLACGALAALFVRSPQAAAATGRVLRAVLALVAGLVAIELVAHTPALAAALRLTEANLLFGALVLLAAMRPGLAWLAPLRSRFCRFIADTSFCAYLVHVPLIAWVDRSGLTAAASPFVAAGLRAAWVLPATFALAAVSRHVVEVPMLRLKRVLAP